MSPYKLYCCILFCFFNYRAVATASTWKTNVGLRETSNQFIGNAIELPKIPDGQKSHKIIQSAQTVELEENLNLIFKIVSYELRKLLIRVSDRKDFSNATKQLYVDTKLLASATDSLITNLSSELAQKVSSAREQSYSINGRQAETWLGAFGPIILKDIGTGFLKLCFLNLLWYFSPATFSFITSLSLSSLLGISG